MPAHSLLRWHRPAGRVFDQLFHLAEEEGGIGRRGGLAVARAGRLRRGGHILPHAAGGIRQLLRRLLGKSEQAALLPQQKRLLRLQRSGKRTAKLRVDRPSQRPCCQHKTDGCKTKQHLRPQDEILLALWAAGPWLFLRLRRRGCIFPHGIHLPFFQPYAGGAKNIRPICGADSRVIGSARSLPPLTRRGSCAAYRSVPPAAWRAWQKAPARSHPAYIPHWWSHRRPAAAP